MWYRDQLPLSVHTGRQGVGRRDAKADSGCARRCLGVVGNRLRHAVNTKRASATSSRVVTVLCDVLRPTHDRRWTVVDILAIDIYSESGGIGVDLPSK